MHPAPATKANELLDVLQRLDNDRQPSEFELTRVEREAEKLVRSGGDPAKGHMVAGIASAFRGDWQEYERHFRISSELSPSRHVRHNNIKAGLRLAYASRPLALARELMQAYPDDLAVLKLVREVAVQTLEFEMIVRVQSALNKLGVGEEAGAEEQIRRLMLVRDRALRYGITSADIVARLDAAGEVLREAREPIFGVLFDFALDGRLGYSLSVKADIGTICDLNFRIVDRLVERFDDTLADLFTIGCLISRRELHATRLSHAGEEAQQ